MIIGLVVAVVIVVLAIGAILVLAPGDHALRGLLPDRGLHFLRNLA